MRMPLSRRVASSDSNGQAVPCVLKGELLSCSETAGSVLCRTEGRIGSLTNPVRLTAVKKKKKKYNLENSIYFQKWQR